MSGGGNIPDMPMPEEPMPPMGNPGQEEPMPEEPMPNEPMPGEGENGNDEEGGVAGDVRKYSGELSQALNVYNDEFPEDEEKLNKYAINMVVAQVKDKLDGKDAKKIANKLIGTGGEPAEDEEMEEPEQVHESKLRESEQIVNEIMDELLRGRKPTKRDELKRNSMVSQNNPFVSNRK